MSKNILFRCDSGSRIGIGHIMRDLVLAEELNQKGNCQIYFACLDLSGNQNQLVEKSGHSLITLSSDSDAELIQAIRLNNIDVVIIDHYQIGIETESQLKDITKVMVIDDLRNQHDCDILLNHNICSVPNWYNELVPSNCKVFTGKRFALIRKGFKELSFPEMRVPLNEDKKNVLISIGGTDPNNLLPEIIKRLESFGFEKINVLTSSANTHVEELRSLAESTANLTLHIDEFHPYQLFRSCGLAIISPSVLASEAIYCELPFIAMKAVDNQSNMFTYLKNEQFYAIDHDGIDSLQKHVRELLDPDKYLGYYSKIKLYKNEMSTGLNDLVDEIYS